MERRPCCVVCSQSLSLPTSSISHDDRNVGDEGLKNCVDSGNHKHLVSALIKCLDSENDADQDDYQLDMEGGVVSEILFCSRCEKYLSEWDQIMTQVSWLLKRANQIKFSLLSWILMTGDDGSSRCSGDGCTESNALNQARTLLERRIDGLKASIRKREFAKNFGTVNPVRFSRPTITELI